ncbi:VOC family protein [Phaeobacter sp. J2-8]|uniref:VOC family protein n=1 Tax=Phaeobacter sp. J2-8 TaxID=2931394 RepID=UPI001FD24968|nr:VOC family protein [Phaeobacter sp. J2-8]MCJ7872555.1 VOC family protein [Phaeobacter sp. J2-8]
MKLAPATPELPVRDVISAQIHYRDRFGFDIRWHNPEGRIGAVSHGECALFLRAGAGAGAPAVVWIFAEDVVAVHADLIQRGAEIVDPLADRPWGLRQFTARDGDGNILHFFHDLDL